MNTTEDRTYTMQVPKGAGKMKDLISGNLIDVSKPVAVAPLSTVVLDWDSDAFSDP